MRRYIVRLSERAFYRVTVDASDEKEAATFALKRRVPLGIRPYDFATFKVERVEFLFDTPRRAKYRRRTWKWLSRLNRRRGS